MNAYLIRFDNIKTTPIVKTSIKKGVGRYEEDYYIGISILPNILQSTFSFLPTIDIIYIKHWARALIKNFQPFILLPYIHINHYIINFPLQLKHLWEITQPYIYFHK